MTSASSLSSPPLSVAASPSSNGFRNTDEGEGEAEATEDTRGRLPGADRQEEELISASSMATLAVLAAVLQLAKVDLRGVEKAISMSGVRRMQSTLCKVLGRGRNICCYVREEGLKDKQYRLRCCYGISE